MKTEEEIKGYEQREEDENKHHRGGGAPPTLRRRSGRDRHETLHSLTSSSRLLIRLGVSPLTSLALAPANTKIRKAEKDGEKRAGESVKPSRVNCTAEFSGAGITVTPCSWTRVSDRVTESLKPCLAKSLD